MKSEQALALMQRECPSDALWFARYGRALVPVRVTVLLSMISVAAGFMRFGLDLHLDLRAAGCWGFGIGLPAWFVLARARFLIALRNHIALDGFVGRFDPTAHLRTSRAFSIRMLAWGVATIAAVGANLVSGSGEIALLAAAAGFAAVAALSWYFRLS